jgi:hypothetical protein
MKIFGKRTFFSVFFDIKKDNKIVGNFEEQGRKVLQNLKKHSFGPQNY